MSQRNLKQVDIINLCNPLCKKYNVKLAKNDLSQYVNNKAEPGQKKISILAEALNVNEAWLMGYDVSMDAMQPIKPTDNSRLNEFIKLCEQLDEDELSIIENLVISLLNKRK